MSLSEQRQRMVQEQLVRRGIYDERLLAAFRSVPRELFVPDEAIEHAYDDGALPIGFQQTISQPYVVALTAQALMLTGRERVLEVGTGLGYAAAILGKLVKQVVSVERVRPLAREARVRLMQLGVENVLVRCADGTLGATEHAPYDAIAVAAGGPDVPRALIAQLAVGGRLVMPVGRDENEQQLVRVTKNEEGVHVETLGEVRFVPLIGEQGWPDREPATRPMRMQRRTV